MTGEKFSVHNATERQKQSPYEAVVVILTMERQKLYARIEQRIDLMMEAGLLDEVKKLLDMGYDGNLVSMQGLGYKEFLPYFAGEISLEKAVEDLKIGTRHFAKRQLTWFRRQLEGLWIDLSEIDKQTALQMILQDMEKKGMITKNKN